MQTAPQPERTASPASYMVQSPLPQAPGPPLLAMSIATVAPAALQGWGPGSAMPGEDGTQGCPRVGTLAFGLRVAQGRCEAPNLPLCGREVAGMGHRRGQGHPLLRRSPGHRAGPHLTAPHLHQTQCERAQARTSSSGLATASAASRQAWKRLIPSMLSPREGMRSHTARPKPQPARPGCRRPGTRWQRWEEGAKPPGMGTGSSMQPGCGPAAGGP